MKQSILISYLLFIIFLVSSCTKPQETTRLVEVGNGFSSTSVNTAVFRTNSLVTHGDTQYISYYDPEGYLTLAKRTLGSDTWTVQQSQYKGNVNDGHNIISMMVDGDGYIHISFDHHNNPLNYCRSVEPGSLTLGDKEPMTGMEENEVTYPEFHRLDNGDLIFVYRDGGSGRGNMVMNRYDLKTKTWQRVQDVLIDGQGERNAYWQMYIDPAGTIHLSWVWRETWLVETNHDMCYARSKDGGKTWMNSMDEPIELPITKDNAEYACTIPQNSELINQTSMTADAKGNPYIATYWRDQDSDIPQYRLIWNDGDQWHSSQVSDRQTPFSLKGGGTKMIPIARPRLVVNEAGEAWYIFRDEERGSKVSMYHSDNILSGNWEVTDLTDFSVNAWEPSLDTELWKTKRQLNIFVQDTRQGDGEQLSETQPQPVYVLEVRDASK